MRVLVTGASGFVGAALCRALLARGHAVRAGVRRRSAPAAELPPGLTEILVPDLAAEDLDWRALVEGVDAVAHLAAIAHRTAPEAELRRVNVDATVRLADAARGFARRFVFMSSVKVHGDDSGEGAYSETDPTRPQDAYGRSKLDAERLLGELGARGGMEIALLRPPLVYGPGVKGNFLRLLQWIDSGLPIPLAAVRNRRNLIYVGNLADAVVRCIEHPRSLGPFLFGDAEIVSTAELVLRAARALGRPARLVSVPPGLLRFAGWVTGRSEEVRRLTGNLVTDTSKARHLLDWQAPYTLDQGLAETAHWFRSTRA